MWGIVFLLCLNFYISSAVDYTFGTNAVLVCESNVQYYGKWKKSPLGGERRYTYLNAGAGKYGTINSKSLTIYNLNFDDSGYYRCTFLDSGVWTNGNEQLLTVITEPGLWSEWTSWTTCSTSCGTGTQSKSRVCNSGVCIGDSTKTITCTRSNCKVTANIGNEVTLQCDNIAVVQSYYWLKDGSRIPETHYIRRGMSGTLTCTVHTKTNPDVTFVWWIRHADTQSPTTINNNPSKYSGGNLVTPSLTIYTASNTDDGSYSCMVSNNEGTTRANTWLIVGVFTCSEEHSVEKSYM